MPSAILYRKNLIFAEVIFANLQEIAKFIAHEKRAPYGIITRISITFATCTCKCMYKYINSTIIIIHLYSRSMLLEGRLGGSSPDSPSSYCPATDHVHYYYCMSNEAVANYLRKSRVATYLFFALYCMYKYINSTCTCTCIIIYQECLWCLLQKFQTFHKLGVTQYRNQHRNQ